MFTYQILLGVFNPIDLYIRLCISCLLKSVEVDKMDGKELSVTVSAVVKDYIVDKIDQMVEKGIAKTRSDYIKKCVEYCLRYDITWEKECEEE